MGHTAVRTKPKSLPSSKVTFSLSPFDFRFRQSDVLTHPYSCTYPKVVPTPKLGRPLLPFPGSRSATTMSPPPQSPPALLPSHLLSKCFSDGPGRRNHLEHVISSSLGVLRSPCISSSSTGPQLFECIIASSMLPRREGGRKGCPCSQTSPWGKSGGQHTC